MGFHLNNIPLDEQLQDVSSNNAVIWVSSPLMERAKQLLPELSFINSAETPSVGLGTVVVIGGGSLIDKAKLWRHRSSPNTKLIAVPSIWGSGSEGNGIALEILDGAKKPVVDESLKPDSYYYTDQFLDITPDVLKKRGVGDAFSHALEAFFSPLASPQLRGMSAELLKDMLKIKGYEDIKWFEFSLLASQYQEKSSVGLIHGIAHTLEPCTGLGHAELCSLYLYPVLKFNSENSPKVDNFFLEYGLNKEEMFQRTSDFFDPKTFADLLPKLKEYWPLIIRNPLSRVNSVLVRASSVGWFEEFFNE